MKNASTTRIHHGLTIQLDISNEFMSAASMAESGMKSNYILIL